MEVVILAGGQGTRLRSVVSDVPKCMAPVGGKPFLAYLLEGLQRYPVTHVVLSVGYLKEAVIDWVDARTWPFTVDYAVEDRPLGTGGGIRLALSKCRGNRVVVLNGDTLFNVDLDALPFDAPVTVALKPMHGAGRYGTVELEGDLITAFHEKKPCGQGLINGGVYALDRSQLDLGLMPERFSFEEDILAPLSEYGQVAGWVQEAYFIDIGVPEDYARAQLELPELQAILDASDAVLASGADTLLLDRDGVVNRWLPGDYVRTWDQFAFLPGIRECLRKWAARFPVIAVVSNQRGVGKGMMTREELDAVHARMLSEVHRTGGRIDGVYVCTALSDKDPRRKPNPGMYEEVMRDFPAAHKAVMVGDSDYDRDFAARCGIPFIRMETAILRLPEAASSDSSECPV